MSDRWIGMDVVEMQWNGYGRMVLVWKEVKGMKW